MASILWPWGALADDRAAVISDALNKWRDDFNARVTARICDIFSPELRYDFRGAPERGFADICPLLRQSLQDTTKRYFYDLRIKEVLGSGDLAVVRLVWHLTTTSLDTGKKVASDEPGLDVFRRQADGSWKIIRYIAYDN